MPASLPFFSMPGRGLTSPLPRLTSPFAISPTHCCHGPCAPHGLFLCNGGLPCHWHLFFLRPGDYCGVPSLTADNLFRLTDVTLWVVHRQLDLLRATAADLLPATFVTLTFTLQKNGVRGERIGHSRSGHPNLCPVLCMVNRIVHIRAHNPLPTIPINAVWLNGWTYVLPSHLTHALRATVSLHPSFGFAASDVSARSTRAGGAMALLCGGINSDRIRLIGRWRSNEMYRYLHVQAQPVMNGVAAAMFHGGHYHLHPGTPTLPPPPPGP